MTTQHTCIADEFDHTPAHLLALRCPRCRELRLSFVVDVDDPQRPAHVSERTFDDVLSAIVTARAVGSRAAVTITEGTRWRAERRDLDSAVYDVAVDEEPKLDRPTMRNAHPSGSSRLAFDDMLDRVETLAARPLDDMRRAAELIALRIERNEQLSSELTAKMHDMQLPAETRALAEKLRDSFDESNAHVLVELGYVFCNVIGVRTGPIAPSDMRNAARYMLAYARHNGFELPQLDD